MSDGRTRERDAVRAGTSPDEPYELSSGLTESYVFGTPFFGVVFYGFFTFAAISGGEPVFPVVSLLFGGIVVWYWARFLLPLKVVTAVPGGLLVSNFRRKIHVPYEQIAEVREQNMGRWERITVQLRRPCAFGMRFVFMPHWRLVFFSPPPHPIALELRARVAAARASPATARAHPAS